MSPLAPGHDRDAREPAGISQAGVSRRFSDASPQELEPLATRRFDDLELLIINPDGWFLASTM